MCVGSGLTGCAQGLVPEARNVNIPAPAQADARRNGINERPDSIIYLPLGRDVLVPLPQGGEPLPDIEVGPYELRGETLGGALQLVLSDVDIPIAFQTDLGLSRKVTVTNMRGRLAEVVSQVCSLADLYCAFEKGVLVVKERQMFSITIPPLGTTETRAALMAGMADAIEKMVGREPIVDAGNRTIVYEASDRTSDMVDRYFQKLRTSTALIVYETYVWEVSLNAGASSGINWDAFSNNAKWKFGVSLTGTVDPDVGSPISIGLPTTGDLTDTAISTSDILKFISSYGAVKTISQPQLTMLSGSTAKLRVADKQNYVSKITRTVSGDQVTVATDTASVESGFTMNIESAWDNATVYGNIDILLQDVRDIEVFDDNPESVVQLPQTTEREVTTQVRVRPGDSLLIAGLVRENDTASREGPGIEKPIFPTSRSNLARNAELVFLLKPRVVVFTDDKLARVRMPVESDQQQSAVTLPRGEKTARSVPEETQPTDATGPDKSSDTVSNLFTHDVVTVQGEEDAAPLPPVNLIPPPSMQDGQGVSVPVPVQDDVPPAALPVIVDPVSRAELPPVSVMPAPAPVTPEPAKPMLQNGETAADIAAKVLNDPLVVSGDKK